MQCWQKAEDKQKTIQTAIKAARLFVKVSIFHHKYSPEIRLDWSNSFSDGVQCFRIAADILKNDNKFSIAVSVLQELGNTEKKFELYHCAGSTFEEAVTICLENKLHLQLLFDSIYNCIVCYTMGERIDLAMLITERVLSKISHDIPDQPHIQKSFLNLKIFKAIILLCLFKHDELVLYTVKNFDQNVSVLFHRMSEATKKKMNLQL